MENTSVMSQYHSMKFNVVIHKLLQNKDWETHTELMEVLTEFLNIIKVKKEEITVKAIHRLHSKNGKKPLPLIIKLESLQQRDMILSGAYKYLNPNSTELFRPLTA